MLRKGGGVETDNNVELHNGYYLDNKKAMHTFVGSQNSILSCAGYTFLPIYSQLWQRFLQKKKYPRVFYTAGQNYPFLWGTILGNEASLIFQPASPSGNKATLCFFCPGAGSPPFLPCLTLRLLTWAAITRCLSAIKLHFLHWQSLHMQNRLWPFRGEE